MGVRQYAPETGFTSIDPLWESFRAYTPYHYSYLNPVAYKDPSGMFGVPMTPAMVSGDGGAELPAPTVGTGTATTTTKSSGSGGTSKGVSKPTGPAAPPAASPGSGGTGNRDVVVGVGAGTGAALGLVKLLNQAGVGIVAGVRASSAALTDAAGSIQEGAVETTDAVGEYGIGIYKDIKGTVLGLDAHHVGQKAIMVKLVPDYDPATAPAILVPKVGHTIRGPNGIVSRSTAGLTNPRDVIARDISELRRVYPDVPNAQLQGLIQMNKDLYPVINK